MPGEWVTFETLPAPEPTEVVVHEIEIGDVTIKDDEPEADDEDDGAE